MFEVISFVIGLMSLPECPGDGQPTIGEATEGVVVGVTSRANLLVVTVGPDGIEERLGGPLLGDEAEMMVTSAAEADGLALTAPCGNGASAGQGLEGIGRREAVAVIAEFGE